jgi:hypothetical protein
VRGDDCHIRALLQPIERQLEADQKHVEDHAELCDHTEERRDVGWQHHRGPRLSQQRWPQQDSSGNLADDRRLPDPSEDPGEHLTGDNDRCQRDQDMRQRVRRPASRERRGGFRQRGRRRQLFPAIANDEKERGRAERHQAIGERRARDGTGLRRRVHYRSFFLMTSTITSRGANACV